MVSDKCVDPQRHPAKGSNGDFANCFDEAWLAPGHPRDHWHTLLATKGHAQAVDYATATENARRILRDHGVTYNATDGTNVVQRPWELDAIPFVIEASEWATIEAGAIQRAKLLNYILNDIYVGPQRLLRDGFIPPGLVFPNPNFLRACRGIRVPGDVYLHLLAIDIARNADGRWVVLSDRTQTPSGMGYALENRTIIGRILPHQFGQGKVRRLQSFFNAFRQNLRDLAPSPTGWPRIVFMTAGSNHEAYYEHSLLARFLGVTLVEGSDLTIRERKVFLRTLEGLQRVDVIVRRINDTYCDPLELAAESRLGVPGLVEAVRSGNVLVANGLGSALVESPALIPYLPDLCQHLFSEEAILPSAATWWCGNANEAHHVRDSLDSLIIKGAFDETARYTISGAEADSEARERLAGELLSNPYQYVGQEQLPLSQAPIWNQDKLENRPVVLRVYVTANKDSYQVLPGGLTKVSPYTANPVNGFQAGGMSKDTWVLGSDESFALQSKALELETRPAERLTSGVPSRVADNLYWLGRYSERLDHRVQLVQTVISRFSDTTIDTSIEIAAICPLIDAHYHPSDNHANLTINTIGQATLDLIYASDQPDGIVALLSHLARIVTNVRDLLSATTWRIFNRLNRYPGPLSRVSPHTRARTKLQELTVDLAALRGMTMDNMTRGIDWRFLDLGYRIERAANIADLLHSVLANQRETTAALNPVLEIADSTMTYRRRYFSEPDTASTLELLLQDSSNPRAFAFQLDRIENHLKAFPSPLGQEATFPEMEKLQDLRQLTESNEIRELTHGALTDNTTSTEAYFQRASVGLNELSKLLTDRYIHLTPPDQRIG